MNMILAALLSSSLGMYNPANCDDFSIKSNGTVFEMYQVGKTLKLKFFIINNRHRTLKFNQTSNTFKNELMEIEIEETEKGLKFNKWISKEKEVTKDTLCFAKQLVHEQA